MLLQNGPKIAIAVAHTTPLDAVGCAVLAEHGAALFELDLRLIGGRPVVTHYLDLGGLRFIQRHNWRLRLAHRGTRYDSLDEALAVIPPQCRVSLDLKDDKPQTSGALVHHLLQAVSEPARFVACSNHWLSLSRLSAAGFETWASVGSRSALARVGEALDLASGITVRHSYLSADLVRTARENGRIVAAWTVNDVERAERLLGWGVDAITTDNPAVLARVASARDGSAGG